MRGDRDKKGIIFNVQHYSVHDGPGIRTTVFMKGCPLRCFWCQNPESQAPSPEIFLNLEKCTGCGKCAPVCGGGAIEIIEGRSKTNRKLCQGAGKCAEECPDEARTLMGRQVTAGEIFEQVAGDSIFYQRSGGGVTLSGGEPFAQPEFAASLLKLCQEAGIHTALETCGYAKWETMVQVLEHTDLVLYDLKQMDSVKHMQYTGVANELILDNIKKIHHELSIPILARIPIIPGANDSVEDIRKTAAFIAAELGDGIKVHLLPYHKLGQVKFARLERAENLISIEPPSEQQLEELKKIVESFGLSIFIGG